MAAAASDKTRFFMEQSVPELQEYARKGIFSAPEIAALAHKRSDFEHLINLPGAATAADYARYATYEVNLDTLRKKRCNRLAIKTTAFSGQKKIFFILERGVRRYQGDMGLWLQYLEFCKSQKSNKKLARALTQCLRMHPMRWELWVWAARFYLEEQSDMTTGRSYFQRGLRFCRLERRLWLEYAKLEMTFVAKIATRRKILGVDNAIITPPQHRDNLHDADVIALPQITAEDLNPDLQEDTEAVDRSALAKLAASPALAGAIPIKIMETALETFKHDSLLAEQFFDLFFEFGQIQCTSALLDKVVSILKQQSSIGAHGAKPCLAYCEARLELFQTQVLSAEFPLALGRALQKLSCPSDVDAATQTQYAVRTVMLLAPYLQHVAELDTSIASVLEASITRNAKKLLGSHVRRTDWLPQIERRPPSYARLLKRFGLLDADT